MKKNKIKNITAVLTAAFCFFLTACSNGTESSVSASSSISSSEAHVHSMTHYYAVEPTCTKEGNSEYWYCSECGKYFSDEEGNIEIDLEDTVLEAKGHDWDTSNIEWTWNGFSSATATFTCLNDSSHQEVIDASVTSSQTKDPTCLEEGELTYTASVSFEGNTYTDSKTDPVSALGHDWDTVNVEWKWEGFTKAAATFTCLNDGSHTQEIEADITDAVTTEPTCLSEGERTYTASVTFNGQTYTDKKTDSVAALGHSWNLDPSSVTWKWEGFSSAIATFKCTNDSEHTCDAEASVTSEITTASTCTDEGERTYTASVTFQEQTFTDTRTEAVDPKGHDWNKTTYEWSWNDDYTEAEIIFSCNNDQTHKYPVTAKVTSVTYDATCLADGSIVYTAEAEYDEETYTDSKTTVIEAKGHSWSHTEYEWTWNEDYSEAYVTFECENDPSHENRVDAEVSSVTEKATCTETGLITYTAEAVFEEEKFKDVKTETIQETGHDWNYDDITWTWSADYSTALATFTCRNDSSHQETVPASVESETALEATCLKEGYATHKATAEFLGVNYYDNQDETIEATGHDWDTLNISWEWNGISSCSATVTCKNDPDHTDVLEADISLTDSEDATCEKDGSNTYTASVTIDGETYTSTNNETVGKTGHDWDYDNIEWSWNGYTSATATFRCKNDANHTETLIASVGKETVTETDCETEGEYTYTASVTFEEKTYTNTKTEYVDPAGHSWNLDEDSVTWTWSNDHSLVYASFTCQTDPTHIERKIADVLSDTSCDVGGERIYTATVEFEENTFTDTKTLTVEAGEHTMADHVCSRCGYREGLELTLNSDGASYTVSGIGDYATYFADESGQYELCIPDTYNGLPVTSVGKYAFNGNGCITAIDFGCNITTISEGAFQQCSIITTLDIPDTVTTIGYYAFKKCYALTDYTLGKNITSIGDSLFQECTSLTEVSVNSLFAAAGGTFRECISLKKAVFEDGVTELGAESFRSCKKLEYIVLPDTVTSVSTSAFSNASLTAVYWTGSSYTGDFDFNGATVYCYSTDQPGEEGNFWYYDENGDPAIWETAGE